MSRLRSITSLLASVSLLAACGGGDGSGESASAPPPAAAGGGVQTGSGCALVERQEWAAGQLREWYLFPETLPASLSPAGFTTVSDYVNKLTETARGQGRDRFFTYLTSIAEENAFNSSGASAGFGIRLSYDDAARRTFVAEAFEGAPALAEGIDRGDEILAIGTTPDNLRNVSDIMASEGSGGVSGALGPSDPGVTRTLRLSGPAGARTLTVTKRDYNLQPVSPRYGARILDDDGRRVGYLNLRTFISSADPQLRAAFAQFRAAGVTDLIVDFRYNGGGLVSTAELMGDLLGRNRFASDVFAVTTYRPEKSSNNDTRRFQSRSESIAPTRIAFIATGGTASASEFVINGMIPYLGQNIALVGANSFGKPVGQIARDRAACDDRFRIVAFSTRNASGSDGYYNGLASVVPVTCRAADDVQRPFGDPQEASTRAALDFIAGRACTPIPTGQTGQSLGAGTRELLTPATPTAAQRETPGLF